MYKYYILIEWDVARECTNLKYDELMMKEMNVLRLLCAIGANLYVKNLEDDVDDEQLRKEFEHFGTITSARVMRDIHGRSRCFGFVCFDSADAAVQAQKEMSSARAI